MSVIARYLCGTGHFTLHTFKDARDGYAVRSRDALLEILRQAKKHEQAEASRIDYKEYGLNLPRE